MHNTKSEKAKINSIKLYKNYKKLVLMSINDISNVTEIAIQFFKRPDYANNWLVYFYYLHRLRRFTIYETVLHTKVSP